RPPHRPRRPARARRRAAVGGTSQAVRSPAGRPRAAVPPERAPLRPRRPMEQRQQQAVTLLLVPALSATPEVARSRQRGSLRPEPEWSLLLRPPPWARPPQAAGMQTAARPRARNFHLPAAKQALPPAPQLLAAVRQEPV